MKNIIINNKTKSIKINLNFGFIVIKPKNFMDSIEDLKNNNSMKNLESFIEFLNGNFDIIKSRFPNKLINYVEQPEGEFAFEALLIYKK